MTLKELIFKYSNDLKIFARKKTEITSGNVFQKGNDGIQNVISTAISKLAKPNSKIIGADNLIELSKKASEGKRCLILPEHYSNFDYPFIIKFLKDLGPEGLELAKKCVAIAGVKLSEENDAISTLTDGYDSVFVYPTRSIETINDEEKRKLEMQKARSINIASMRKMDELRNEGRVIVVFPTGTRYRPGKPETKKGIREMDTYIKTSDYMVLISINGNCLEVNQTSDMTLDTVKQDTIILEASKIIDCKAFRNNILDNLKEDEDKKQKIVDAVMERLEVMHNRNLV